jgi:hypothetical protein
MGRSASFVPRLSRAPRRLTFRERWPVYMSDSTSRPRRGIVDATARQVCTLPIRNASRRIPGVDPAEIRWRRGAATSIISIRPGLSALCNRRPRCEVTVKVEVW